MPQDQSTADITEILISCKYYLLKIVILTKRKKRIRLEFEIELKKVRNFIIFTKVQRILTAW